MVVLIYLVFSAVRAYLSDGRWVRSAIAQLFGCIPAVLLMFAMGGALIPVVLLTNCPVFAPTGGVVDTIVRRHEQAL